MNKTISKVGLFLLFISISSTLFSQSVSINSTGATPSPNAVLDLNTGNSNNQGLIVPNVTLGASLGTFNPPIANAATSNDVGMIVYNSVSTHQPIGYYYWNGSTWVNVTGAAIAAWNLTGNSGTTVGTNFIGTNDANALEFKVNSQKAGWIDYANATAATFFGYQAGFSNTGTFNTAFGYQALYTNTNGAFLGTGGSTAIGYQALYNSNGFWNTATGYQALYSNTTGWDNTADGLHALYSNTTGNNNTATGLNALYVNTTGTNNTAVSQSALASNITGSSSTAIGFEAGYKNTADANVFVGDSAGYTNTTGKENTFIGYQANAGSGTYNNSTAIGYGATISASNMIELGNSSVTFTGVNGAAHNSSYALSVGTGSGNGSVAYCTIGGVWTNGSDRNIKANFSTPNSEEILNKICTLPVLRWNYKNEPASLQHIGPMAQDFYRIFQVGNDSLHISTIDPAAIALIGVQALNKKLEAENTALKAEISQLTKDQDARFSNDEKQIAELKAMMSTINQAQASAK